MQLKINFVITDYFEQSSTHVEGGPLIFGRCGPFYQLKDALRAFVNGTEVNFVQFNCADDGFRFYHGEKHIDWAVLPNNAIVEFKLDKVTVVYESVIA